MNEPPIIFLDFDGVLNSIPYLSGPRHAADYGDGVTALDPTAVAVVQAACDAVGAEVVISSSWRCMVGGEGWCRGLLERRGLRAPVVGVTPEIRDNRQEWPRGQEIADWRRDHCAEGRPFVVLDDEGPMPEVWRHLIQTSFLAPIDMRLVGVVEAMVSRWPHGRGVR